MVEDNREWVTLFDETAPFRTAFVLRHLFGMVLLEGVGDPLALWRHIADALSDDLITRLDYHNFPADPSNPQHDYALFLIERNLRNGGRSLLDFALPLPTVQWEQDLHPNRLIAAEMAYDQPAQADDAARMIRTLNDGQRAARLAILASIGSENPTSFFLTGPGGSGKTFLYETLCAELRGQGQIVLAVASTGVAAKLIPGGRTSHSRFSIPVPTEDDSVCNISKNSRQAELIRNTALIIWDEISSQHRFCFEAVDRLLRDITDQDELFGGITVVLSGDWQQMLPVVPGGSRAQIYAATLQASYICPNLEHLRLEQNMRLINADPETLQFTDWLGQVGKDPEGTDWTEIPQYVDTMDNVESFISDIFPHDQLTTALADPHNSPFLHGRAILTTTNDDVDIFNSAVLDSLPQHDIGVYPSLHSLPAEADINATRYCTHEYMASIVSAEMQPPTLRICKGMVMMLVRNMNVAAGLCNGTRVIVCHHSRHEVFVRVLGARRGDPNEYASIPRVTLYSKPEVASYRFKRKQFPLRPSFAMTVNKGQGQTLSCVGVDLRNPAFAHGQCYVAFSRATSPKGVKVLLNDKDQRRVPNVVFREVFDYLRNPVVIANNQLEMINAEQQAELAEDDFGHEADGAILYEEEHVPLMGDEDGDESDE